MPILWVTTGFMIAAYGFLLALPLPPGTNSLPAVAFATLSLGLVGDGVFVLDQYLFFLLNALFFTMLPVSALRRRCGL